MSAQREEPLQRVPMSWEEFVQLPEWPRAEWVDGVAVIMNVPPTPPHGSAAVQLAVLLAPLFPDHFVVNEAYLRVPRNRMRIPDVMIATSLPDNWVSEPPLMVAEVLSASTRSEDTLRKSVEYAAAGAGQYWILDPDLRTLEVMGNAHGVWEVLAYLDDAHPAGEVELAGVRVPLDLGQLLRTDSRPPRPPP